MCRATACIVNSVPATLMSKVRRYSWGVMSTMGAAVKTAALLIRMSIRPIRATASSTARAMLPGSATSTCTAMQPPPSASAAACAFAPSMSAMQTRAPSAA